MGQNHSDCCEGLAWRDQRYLHAEDCPLRVAGGDNLNMPFREDPDERRMFDDATDMFGNKPLNQVIATLDTTARMSGRGSFAQVNWIMANEIMKAQARLDKLANPEDELVSKLYHIARNAKPTEIMTGAAADDPQFNWGLFVAAEALAKALRAGILNEVI